MQFDQFKNLELGLGLIGIGRPWPQVDNAVCSAQNAALLLQTAVTSGVRFFDTAAAYGTSEQVLGDFLKTLTTSQRNAIFIATKCGEQWPMPANAPIDHSLNALNASLANSLKHLGSIDLLQLHKCSAKDMQNDEVLNWFQNLKHSGAVKAIGVSCSTIDALKAAANAQIFDSIQFPANVDKLDMLEAYLECKNPPLAIINRPFASGKITDRTKAYTFLKQNLKQGIILTGTSNAQHLTSNLAAFN